MNASAHSKEVQSAAVSALESQIEGYVHSYEELANSVTTRKNEQKVKAEMKRIDEKTEIAQAQLLLARLGFKVVPF